MPLDWQGFSPLRKIWMTYGYISVNFSRSSEKRSGDWNCHGFGLFGIQLLAILVKSLNRLEYLSFLSPRLRAVIEVAAGNREISPFTSENSGMTNIRTGTTVEKQKTFCFRLAMSALLSGNEESGTERTMRQSGVERVPTRHVSLSLDFFSRDAIIPRVCTLHSITRSERMGTAATLGPPGGAVCGWHFSVPSAR